MLINRLATIICAADCKNDCQLRLSTKRQTLNFDLGVAAHSEDYKGKYSYHCL